MEALGKFSYHPSSALTLWEETSIERVGKVGGPPERETLHCGRAPKAGWVLLSSIFPPNDQHRAWPAVYTDY